MDPLAAAARLEHRLAELADPERAVQEKRYLKSSLSHLGVPVPAIRRVAKAFGAAHPELSRRELLALADALWARGLLEGRVCAVELLNRKAALLAPEDVAVLERYLREAGTWALVDNLAAGPAARLVEGHPELGAVLDRWAGDRDFWVRRAALLTLLPALRRGEGDFPRFGRHADAMLEEREFFVRKAIGWVLREVGKKRPELVGEWLAPRVSRASGLTLREAVRHLPQGLRQALLAGRPTRRRSAAP